MEIFLFGWLKDEKLENIKILRYIYIKGSYRKVLFVRSNFLRLKYNTLHFTIDHFTYVFQSN